MAKVCIALRECVHRLFFPSDTPYPTQIQCIIHSTCCCNKPIDKDENQRSKVACEAEDKEEEEEYEDRNKRKGENWKSLLRFVK